MNKVSIFRSGVPAAPAERGCERVSYEAADARRPVGRQGRMDAVFCSPTLPGVTRWVRGNAMCKQGDVLVREIVVDADSVYVYSVRAWEGVGGFRGESAITDYWATGMTLTDWLATDLDPKDWEVLIGANDIISVRNVSDKRVIEAEADEYDRNVLARELKDARRNARFTRLAA